MHAYLHSQYLLQYDDVQIRNKTFYIIVALEFLIGVPLKHMIYYTVIHYIIYLFRRKHDEP